MIWFLLKMNNMYLHIKNTYIFKGQQFVFLSGETTPLEQTLYGYYSLFFTDAYEIIDNHTKKKKNHKWKM